MYPTLISTSCSVAPGRKHRVAKRDDISIIDTSSIIEIRRGRGITRTEAGEVYAALTKLVVGGSLVFPDKVFEELHRWVPSNPPSVDLPLEWVTTNRARATQLDGPYGCLVEVLGEVPEVCEVDRVTVGGIEDADPYVLAMAMHLDRQGYRPTVVTEDRKDRPDKMSLATACGVLHIPSVPLLAFLAQQRIRKRSS
jgi:hypothetical protein